MGIFDYSPGPPTIPGFPVGTIFDDNATNDIVNINPVGAYGAGPPTASPRGAETDYIGHWRPESDFINGETLAAFVQAAKSGGGVFNGPWTLQITDQVPKDFGQVQAFSLQFSSTQTASSPGAIASQFTYPYQSANGDISYLATNVVLGALGNTFTGQGSIPASPNWGSARAWSSPRTTRWGPTARIKAGSTRRSSAISTSRTRRGVKNPTHEHRHLPGVLRRRRSDLEQPGAGQRRPSGRRRL